MMSQMKLQKNYENTDGTVICTNCFKSLGVDARMHIYRFLLDNKEATVTQLVEQIDLTQPTVSYHLAKMKEDGLLLSTRKGKEVHYRINPKCPYFNDNCVLSSINFPQQEDIRIC